VVFPLRSGGVLFLTLCRFFCQTFNQPKKKPGP